MNVDVIILRWARKSRRELDKAGSRIYLISSELHPKWQENAWRLLSANGSHIPDRGLIESCIGYHVEWA